MNWVICSTVPRGYRAVLDCIRQAKLSQKELPISLKSKIKIFIIHSHKPFPFGLVYLYFVKSLAYTPLLTLSPPCTLYIISQYLWWHVLIKHLTHILQWVTLQWSLSTVNFEMICQPVQRSKKQNTFSAWWHGMGSHHCGQSFCLLAPLTLTRGGSSQLLPHEFFSFCSHIQHCHWTIIDMA